MVSIHDQLVAVDPLRGITAVPVGKLLVKLGLLGQHSSLLKPLRLMNIAMKTAYQVSMNRMVPLRVGASGKLQVDLMPTNPVNMMLMDIG
jgi:hypothetical protein